MPLLAEVLEEFSSELSPASPPVHSPLPAIIKPRKAEILQTARNLAAEILARHPFPIFLFLPDESRPLTESDPIFCAYEHACKRLEAVLARLIHGEFQVQLTGYDHAITHFGSFQLTRPTWRLFLPQEFSFDDNDECHDLPLMGWVGFRQLLTGADAADIVQ
jgi:hypothetical protein